MKRIIVFAMLATAASNVFGQEKLIRSVSVLEFKEVMDSIQDEVIIDLRTPDEVKQGKIPGAVIIDFFGTNFEPTIKRLDKNKPYLLYCAGGGRSGETLELMDRMGFRKLYNLETGFRGWVKEKMPVSLK